jgi:hypothetical protein
MEVSTGMTPTVAMGDVGAAAGEEEGASVVASRLGAFVEQVAGMFRSGLKQVSVATSTMVAVDTASTGRTWIPSIEVMYKCTVRCYS